MNLMNIKYLLRVENRLAIIIGLTPLKRHPAVLKTSGGQLYISGIKPSRKPHSMSDMKHLRLTTTIFSRDRPASKSFQKHHVDIHGSAKLNFKKHETTKKQTTQNETRT